MSDLTHISTEFQGQNRILALWPDGAATHDGDGKKVRAYEVATRMTTELQALERGLAAVDGNDRLSALGKRDAKAERQFTTLKVIAGQLQKLDSAKYVAEKLQKQLVTDALGDRDESDLRSTLIDLKIADRISEMEPRDLMLGLEMDSFDQSILYPMATLPGVLTGLSESQIAKARQNAIYRNNPDAARQAESENEVFNAGYDALAAAWKLVASGVDLHKRQQADSDAFTRLDASSRPSNQAVPNPPAADDVAA